MTRKELLEYLWEQMNLSKNTVDNFHFLKGFIEEQIHYECTDKLTLLRKAIIKDDSKNTLTLCRYKDQEYIFIECDEAVKASIMVRFADIKNAIEELEI